MTTPRRRIIRPQPLSSPSPVTTHKIAALTNALRKEREGLSRWMTRLRRAFHAVERHQQRISRIERQIKKLEEGSCSAPSR